MSVSSERKRVRETLAQWSLMTVHEVAAFLGVHEDTARSLPLPWVQVGRQKKLDPLDLAVHVLAEREGLTAEDYWDRHGEETPAHARRYVTRIRKAVA